MNATTTKPRNPEQSLEDAGVVLSDRERNIVAATTARARALAIASFIEILADFEEEVHDLPNELFDRVENLAITAGMQQELAGVVVAAVVRNQD